MHAGQLPPELCMIVTAPLHSAAYCHGCSADNITSLCWFRTSASSQAQLLLSLAGGGLVALTPPSQPCSSSEQHAALELDHSCTFITAAEVPLLQLAAIPPSKHAPSISSNGGSNQQTQQVGAQVLGLGSDGQLHRLLLPADTAGWAGLKGKVIRSIAKLQLPVPGTAIALSPSGHSMMLAGQDGSLISLPALSAAATATALAAYSNSSAKSSAGAADSSIAGSALAHGSSEQGAAAGVLAWSATGQWAASAARDGSLLLHAAIGKQGWDVQLQNFVVPQGLDAARTPHVLLPGHSQLWLTSCHDSGFTYLAHAQGVYSMVLPQPPQRPAFAISH